MSMYTIYIYIYILCIYTYACIIIIIILLLLPGAERPHGDGGCRPEGPAGHPAACSHCMNILVVLL